MMSCLVGPLSQERVGGLHSGSCHLPTSSGSRMQKFGCATLPTSASFCSFSPVLAGEAAEAAEAADFVSALAAASTAGALGALGGSAVDLAKGCKGVNAWFCCFRFSVEMFLRDELKWLVASCILLRLVTVN